MLKVRVIPTLLWKDFGLVKGVGFNSWRRVGSVLPAIKVYNSRDVDELVLVDITASSLDAAPDHESVSDFSQECAVPLTVGGGVTDLKQITALLHAGADKVSLNSAIYEKPALIGEAADRFGSQCVVASIDARRHDDGRYTTFSHSGTRDTGRDPVAWAREAVDRGAGEILLTSIDRDGTMQGYDLALIERVASAVPIPVIASGGAGSYQHMVDAVVRAGASAGAKQALHDAGVPVRRNFVTV
jgi:cyclase